MARPERYERRAETDGYDLPAQRERTGAVRGAGAADARLAYAPGVESAAEAPRRDRGAAAAAAIRGGSGARGEARGRGGGHLSRLLQEPHHRRDAPPPDPAGPGLGAAGADRGHV